MPQYMLTLKARRAAHSPGLRPQAHCCLARCDLEGMCCQRFTAKRPFVSSNGRQNVSQQGPGGLGRHHGVRAADSRRQNAWRVHAERLVHDRLRVRQPLQVVMCQLPAWTSCEWVCALCNW